MAEPVGLGAPEKTIVINTPNKTLDKLAGKAETKEPVVEKTTTAEVETTEEQTGGSAIRSFEEEKEPVKDKVTSEVDTTKVDDKSTETTEKTVEKEPVVEDNGEVDLTEIAIDVDGQERSVAELLDERDVLAKRVAEYESDPFLKGMIDHYKATGNIDAYYEAKGVNWDKKDDIEVIRIQFDRENADLDKETRELLWEEKISGTYKIKADLSQEELESKAYKIGQGLLKRDAQKAREQFKEGQKKYQAPEKVNKEAAPPQKFDPNAFKQQLLKEKEVQAFAKNKLLPIGVKDGAGKTLGFEPKNPDQIIEMMVDDRKFWNVFIDPGTKQVDRTKVAKVYAYAQDPDFYEQSLVNLGRNLHLEDRLKEQKQTDERLNRKTGGAPPKESFAKGFLGAAVKQKK